MHITISDRKEIEYTVTSDIDDDSYSFEVRYKDKCIFGFNINNEGRIEMMAGEIDNYWIDLTLLEEIILEAKTTLKKEQDEWLKSKGNYEDM